MCPAMPSTCLRALIATWPTKIAASRPLNPLWLNGGKNHNIRRGIDPQPFIGPLRTHKLA